MLSLIFGITTMLLLTALPYLIAYWKMLKRTFWCFCSVPAASDQMPEHLKTFFQPFIAELESHGFQVAEFRLVGQTVGDDKQWSVLLQHASQQIYALCIVSQPFNAKMPLLLMFLTFLEDGRLLGTVNTKFYGIYSRNPEEIAQHLPSVPIVEQWQAHQQKMKLLSQTTVFRSLSPPAFIALWKDHSQRSIERLVQTQEVYWVAPGESYRMTWWTTAKAIFKVVRARARERQPSQRQADVIPHPMPSVDSTLALEVEQFYQWQQRQKGGLSRRTKRWLLLGTLALFVAVYALRFDPQRLVIFVAALMLHEGGHVLAMKCCGYRDTTMLFVPFLGALATARKQNASLTEKVWISLAGPLPGLILGIGLAIAFNISSADPAHFSHWYAESNWVREASTILIILNLFNLLPIYPLDGGQIADLLLFSRNPYLGILFKGVGVLLLGLCGLQQPMMLVFTILIGASLPQSFRLAKLNTTLRQELRQFPCEASEHQLVRFLFSKLQDSPYKSLPFARKYYLVLGLLESRRENSAKWKTRVGLSSIYFLSLLTGIFGGLYSFLPNWHSWTTVFGVALQKATYEKSTQQAIERADQRLKANPKDIQAYVKRGQARLVLKDYQGALSDANQILQLEPNAPQGYVLRSEVRLQLKDKTGAAADVAKVRDIRNMALARRIQQLNQALTSNPRDISAYLERASLHSKLRHYTATIVDCNNVLRLDPHNVAALLNRGNAYLGMKDYNQAILDANYVISIQSDSVEAYDLRSEARHQLGDRTGAKADEEKAYALEQVQDKDQ